MIIPNHNHSQEQGCLWAEPRSDYGRQCLKNVVKNCILRRKCEIVYRHFLVDFGIGIREASSRNFRNVIKGIRQGGDYLRQFQKSNREPLQENRIPITNGLCTEETELFKFLIDNFRFQHASRDLENILSKHRPLLSLRERLRRGYEIDNRHTSASLGQDDNVFFTMGIGHHQCPIELRDRDAVAIKAWQGVAKEYVWVSSHINEFVRNAVYSNKKFHGTEYSQFFNFNDLTHRYVYYNRHHASKFDRTVKLSDEVFAGRHVLPGIAFEFILQLRFIGDPYRSDLLSMFDGSAISEDEKLKKVKAAMGAVMPGWIWPEAKIPIEVPLHLQDMTIERPSFKFSPPFLESKLILESGNPEFIKSFAANSTTLKLKDCEKILKGFIKKQAAECVEAIIQLQFPDDEDPDLFHRIDLNQDTGLGFGEDSFIELAVEKGTPEILRILAKNGGNIKRQSVCCLRLAAKRNDFAMFVELIDLGADLSEDKGANKSSLMHFASHGNVEAIKYLAESRVDLNCAFHQRVFYTSIGLLSQSHCTGFTPLHYAVMYGKLDGVKALCQYGAAIDGAAPFAGSPLSLAIASLMNPMSDEDWEFVLSGNTFELLSARAQIISFLESVGAKDIPPFERPFSSQILAAVGLVTGRDKDGRRYVVLGKKADDSGRAKGYLLPEGLQDFDDASSLKAAMREIKEETSLDLAPLVSRGVVKPELMYRFDEIFDETHYKTDFYKFDVGSAFSGAKPLGKDDFLFARKIPLDSIIQNLEQPYQFRFKVKNEPLRATNGLLISTLQSKNTSLDEMAEMAQIEHFGFALLETAVVRGNLKRIESLVDHGVPLDLTTSSGDDIFYPAYDNLDVIKLLIRKGGDLNFCSIKYILYRIAREYGKADDATQSKYLEVVDFLTSFFNQSNAEKFAQALSGISLYGDGVVIDRLNSVLQRLGNTDDFLIKRQ